MFENKRSVFFHHPLEDWPFDAANKTPGPPRMPCPFCSCRSPGEDLLVEILDSLLRLAQPLVPVVPDSRPAVLLLLEKADAIVELPHALRNLLRCLGLAQMGRRERDSIEELLEAAVDECAEQARSYLLPRQSSQDAELRLSVDEMLNLWSVDSQENLLGWLLSIRGCQERLFGW